MAKVMAEVPAVPKADRNSAQNFSFRGVDAVVNALGPALRKHGVIILPHLNTIKTEQVEIGRNKTVMNAVTVDMSYTFMGPEGDQVCVRVPGESLDAGDKATPKAMSVALRTALLQTFALPTDEKDPDMDTYERAPAEAPDPELEEAKAYLLKKVHDKNLERPAVATLFRGEFGHTISEATDPKVIRDFADRLAPGE
jgi:hypothetical protein